MQTRRLSCAINVLAAAGVWKRIEQIALPLPALVANGRLISPFDTVPIVAHSYDHKLEASKLDLMVQKYQTQAVDRSSIMCYTCTHCNQCGMYSTVATIVCKECKTPIPIGQAYCPQCQGRTFETIMVPVSTTQDRSRGNPM